MQTLATASQPLAIESLMELAAGGASRATIQRRLEELREGGLVGRIGKARGTRHFLTEKGREAMGVKIEPARQPYYPAYVPGREWTLEPASRVSYPAYQPRRDRWTGRVSEPGVDDVPEGAFPDEDPEEAAERERLRGILHQPVSRRLKVDYQRSFLGDYEPNVTFYLPEELRQELRVAGQSDQMAKLPAGTYVKNVFNRVLIDLSWNSSRLEGNTYSLLETERLLALGRMNDPERMVEARMILNHKEAIEFLVEAQDDIGFNRFTILNLHSLLAHELLSEPYDEGRLRRVGVTIGGSSYQPLDIPQVVEECFMEILRKASAIKDPLEQSFFSMVHLPYLQPFIDGNKRVSRLAANIPLIRENLAPLSFVDVPASDYTDAILAIYELNRLELMRDVFARAYRASAGRYSEVRQGLRAPDPLSLHYHEALRAVAREVVQGGMGKAAAAEHIRHWAQANVSSVDRGRVVEMAESNLLALHEGNFAKYRLRPSEFEAWQAVWSSQL